MRVHHQGREFQRALVTSSTPSCMAEANGGTTLIHPEPLLSKISLDTSAEHLAAINAAATEEDPKPFPAVDLDDAVYPPEIWRTPYAMCADSLCGDLVFTT